MSDRLCAPGADRDGFDAGRLAPYLAQRLGHGAVQIVELIRFPRGSSRETWFVSARVAAERRAAPIELVIRRDFPGGSICPMPLQREYEIYRRLQGSAVPIAEVLWYENDPEAAGVQREFYVRRRIEGDWRIPHFHDPDPRYHGLRIAAAKEHLEKLALVHRCDWRQLGFDAVHTVPDSPADCAGALIEDIEQQLSDFQIEPFPLFYEMKEWLLDQTPPQPAAIVLLKGTNGYGEEVFQQGRIVAMSDWELSRLGDPAYDWAQMQDFSADIFDGDQQIWGLQQALDYYESISGIHVRTEAVEYYRKLLTLNILMFCHHSAVPVCDQRDLMARLCWPATEVVYRTQRNMIAALGLTTPAARVPGQMG